MQAAFADSDAAVRITAAAWELIRFVSAEAWRNKSVKSDANKDAT